MITEILNRFQMSDGLFCLFFETEFEDFVDVLQRFIKCLPLRITSWKKRTFYHIEAIFVFLDKNRKVNRICSGHSTPSC